MLRVLLSLCLWGSALAAKMPGCYCSSHAGCTEFPDTCKCTYSVLGCSKVSKASSGEYNACSACSARNYTATAGCEINMGSYGKTCNCDVSEDGCSSTYTGSSARYTHTWKNSGCENCDTDVPPSPPLPPPLPPKPPPAPPQKCVIPHGGTYFDKTTAESKDPINEPCYSHTSCRDHGNPDTLERGVCCMPRGKCDNIHSNGRPYLSGTANYYMGGCIAINYVSDTVASTSTSDDHPTQTEGCAKQGE